MTDENKIDEVLSRGVEEVIVKENLKKRLMSGKKLRIKLGIDPTGSVLHLGHAVVLRKLKDFQDLGHQVIFLIGDFTARIGDPTGRSVSRKPLTDKDIAANMKSYTKQAGLILDMKKVEIRYNSEWLNKLDFRELVMLSSKVTYAQVAQRADFKERIKNDQDLSLQEFLYPVMQGYDSVALKADVEIGGTDQKFNLLMGRQLQKRYNQEPQEIITCPLLEGLSGGDKMSKSLDNYIALTEKPEEMYGKIMSLTDGLIIRYFTLGTYLSLEKIAEIEQELGGGKVNPRDIKMRLAFEITKIYHGEKKAVAAQEYFVKTVQKKEAPEEVISKKLTVGSMNIMELLVEVGLTASKGEARRLIEQGGIKIDGSAVNDINKIIEITANGVLVQRGKRGFVRVVKK
ncbi:tyrosine--tRNA ligase [Candidatus Falkowbacteria bacterium RIFCSPHIGHO2_02_FULL_42_9]|uniref:Tyrosine--tRNA ligase n=1 Tax=Candidatus Falkowbacteria bacterium RIFCSPHIGHO2_02_FULL_42_9 TaxID=1797986 RepID=A0A1F5SA55_9BACT|nr:MAG: tyrosine--tRNA ligase [Candidatus Falkowbacteria bacterium RIFCSPHIGHO2_02_FULL_42_9]